VQKRLQNQANGGGATTLTWQSQPAFDSQADSLAWSLQVQSGSSKTLNEGVALLGRYGVLEVTTVRSYPLAASPALNKIVSQNISFTDGDRYSNYQSGDKVGALGLAGLIAGDNGDSHPATVGPAAWVYWVYSGLAACVASAGFMILASRKKNRRHRSSRPVVSAPAIAVAKAEPAPVVQITTAAPLAPTPATAAPVALTNVNLNGHAKTNGSNGSNGARNGKQFNRNRRKRVFNYPKFYTHVMKELSFHAYDASPITNGKSRNGNGYANGHANGNHNGANGHTNGTNGTNGANGSNGSGDGVKSGIEELISTQKALIQEQKCLLEQQTRLIEEKRWLIEEQTAFLKGQAGMINEQQFPLKFE
jgi:hypothetical protein